jgi:hypothetical protein
MSWSAGSGAGATAGPAGSVVVVPGAGFAGGGGVISPSAGAAAVVSLALGAAAAGAGLVISALAGAALALASGELASAVAAAAVVSAPVLGAGAAAALAVVLALPDVSAPLLAGAVSTLVLGVGLGAAPVLGAGAAGAGGGVGLGVVVVLGAGAVVLGAGAVVLVGAGGAGAGALGGVGTVAATVVVVVVTALVTGAVAGGSGRSALALALSANQAAKTTRIAASRRSRARLRRTRVGLCRRGLNSCDVPCRSCAPRTTGETYPGPSFLTQNGLAVRRPRTRANGRFGLSARRCRRYLTHIRRPPMSAKPTASAAASGRPWSYPTTGSPGQIAAAAALAPAYAASRSCLPRKDVAQTDDFGAAACDAAGRDLAIGVPCDEHDIRLGEQRWRKESRFARLTAPRCLPLSERRVSRNRAPFRVGANLGVEVRDPPRGEQLGEAHSIQVEIAEAVLDRTTGGEVHPRQCLLSRQVRLDRDYIRVKRRRPLTAVPACLLEAPFDAAGAAEDVAPVRVIARRGGDE